MAKQLEKIFNECIERINHGESPERCLSRYPREAAYLRPMIATYLNVRWRASNVEPRPEFKAQARQQLFSLQTTQRLVKDINLKPSPQRRIIFSMQRVWVPALAAIIAVLMIGSGTVTAAAFSTPDQLLYPVKLATENVRLTFTFSDADKAILNVQLAQARSAEIVAMAQKGKTDLIISTTDKMIKNLEDAETAINNVARSESASVAVAIISSPTLIAAAPQSPLGASNQPATGSTETHVSPNLPITSGSDDEIATNNTGDQNPGPGKTPQVTPAPGPTTTLTPGQPTIMPTPTPVTPNLPLTSGSNDKNTTNNTGNQNAGKTDKTPQITPAPGPAIAANNQGNNAGNGNNSNQGSSVAQPTTQTSASKSEKLIQDVQPILNNTLTKLQNSLAASPESVRNALQQAIDASKARQANIWAISSAAATNSSHSSSTDQTGQGNKGNTAKTNSGNTDSGNSGNSQSGNSSSKDNVESGNSTTSSNMTASKTADIGNTVATSNTTSGKTNSTNNTTSSNNTTSTNNSTSNTSNHSNSNDKNDHTDRSSDK